MKCSLTARRRCGSVLEGDRIAAKDSRRHNRLGQLMDERAANEGAGLAGAAEQGLKDQLFGRIRGDQGDFVYPATLPDAVDAATPLMQPRRRPWQLVMDDKTAGVMQIQPFRGCVRRHHHGSSLRKLPCRCNALVGGEAAVQQHHTSPNCREALAQPQRRVAVLGKDDCGGADPGQQAEEQRGFAFGDGCGLGGTEALLDGRPFAVRIVETLSGHHARPPPRLRPRLRCVVASERQPRLRFDRRR